MHYVVNEHEWVIGCCEHGELDGAEEKKWLEADSSAHRRLRDSVYNTRLLHTFPYYVNFRFVYPIYQSFSLLEGYQ